MSEALVQSLLDAVPLPALAIDATERIAAANTEALTLLGQGIKMRNFVTMLRQPALLDAVEGVMRDARPRVAPYMANDGAQDTTFQVSCKRVDGAGWRDAGIVVLTFEDVTHRQQAELMRRDFVANVSHELRTPLTAVMGFIETLRGPARGDPEAQERFLQIMQSEAGRMNRLIGDLLSLSRVEGEERVRPTGQLALRDILDSTLRSLRPLADEAGVTLEPELGALPVDMTGDPDQLTQVFTNLIENGIKYGGSGGRVTVRLSLSEREAALRAPGARVQVIDYGPGIDPVHLPRLTERFYRADSHRSRELGGTGLGLAIVKHIINRHRGRLRVESELGQGATFTVILPISPFTRTATAAAS
ncbi:MAG: ATP-binding protein [Pseudomonadota bacterium]